MKCKYLYTNGDSFTYGSELENPETECYPYLLSQKLGCELVNEAKPGASNERIIRTTLDWISGNLEKINETFFIIGWTSPIRYEDWTDAGEWKCRFSGFTSNKGTFEKFSTSGTDRYEKIPKDEVWKRDFHWHVILLQNIFKQYNIDYVFFLVQSDGVTNSLESLSSNFFIDYNNFITVTMNSWCERVENRVFWSNRRHPTKMGQSSWTDLLYGEINNG